MKRYVAKLLWLHCTEGFAHLCFHWWVGFICFLCLYLVLWSDILHHVCAAHL